MSETQEVKRRRGRKSSKGAAPEQEVTAAPSEQLVEGGPRFVVRTIAADRLNKVRKLVPVGPSVCDICGTDVCEINNLPKYDDLSPALQVKVAALVEKHREERHTVKEIQRADALAAAGLG